MNGSPLKILHILTEKTAGGAGRQLSYLIANADRSAFSHTVVLPAGAESRRRIEEAGAKVVECPELTASFCPAAALPLARVIREENPDIVHTHSSMTGRVVAKRLRRVTVMTKHCSDLPPRPLRRGPLRLFSGLNLRVMTDTAIATDESAALALICAGMPAKKIRLIYNGAPPVRKTSEQDRLRLRGSLGIPENALCVGLFSRLEPVKGALQFVQAAALCLARTDSIRFLVCGKGSLEKTMRELAERFGIAGKIVFAGYAEDVAPYMNLCDIIVSPSLGTETSSLSLCEGMSAGLVPVVTDVGGNARLAEGCGKTVTPDDPPALADAILGLFRDPGLLRLYSEKAVRRYKEKYTAERMAAETHALYLSLVRK